MSQENENRVPLGNQKEVQAQVEPQVLQKAPIETVSVGSQKEPPSQGISPPSSSSIKETSETNNSIVGQLVGLVERLAGRSQIQTVVEDKKETPASKSVVIQAPETDDTSLENSEFSMSAEQTARVLKSIEALEKMGERLSKLEEAQGGPSSSSGASDSSLSTESVKAQVSSQAKESIVSSAPIFPPPPAPTREELSSPDVKGQYLTLFRTNPRKAAVFFKENRKEVAGDVRFFL